MRLPFTNFGNGQAKRVKQTVLCLLIAIVSLTSCSGAKEQVATKKTDRYEVAREGAWCWFADPRAIHYENEAGTINKTFIGYIDIHGNIKASQHDFLTGKTQEVLIRSWFQPDDHNNPTFLVLPDERVMVFYSRHTDEPCFYYRISGKPGDITDLGPEFTIPTDRNTTYPSPFILSDDPDHFYLCWRGISWHPTIAKLSLPDDEGAVEMVWGPNQIVQSTASRPYAKYASNGKDKIYMAYTTGHPDPTMPNYIYFNSIDINSMELKDVTGRVISKIGDELHHVAATQDYEDEYTNAVVDDTQLRDWLWQVTLGKDENPVIAMVRINEDKSSHDYYYARWTGTEWQKTFLTNAGGHFHQSPDIEKCYSGGMAIDDQNPNEIYCSVPVSGKYGEVYELVKYTINEQGEVSQTDSLTKDSKLNNVRPFIIPNRNDSPLKLTWMYGDYHDWIVSKERPQGYCTSVYADYNLKGEAVDLTSGLVSDASYSAKETGNRTFQMPESDEYSIFLELELDTSAYSGTLLSANNFEYAVNGESMKPSIRCEESTSNSTNILGNSDGWKEAPRSTDGAWCDPVKYTSVRLTLVYSDYELKSYLNGLVDQVVGMNGFKFTQFQVGEFATKIKTCKVYNRTLNQAEINQLSGN
ncbi:BNR repeat-containing protein [Mangrovibacterium sp.]|uniref:BNR repeat-containing protein n=1 Tax=Mangrovibacterium sp. TaxID=1961364 RepID=UPI0035680A41